MRWVVFGADLGWCVFVEGGWSIVLFLTCYVFVFGEMVRSIYFWIPRCLFILGEALRCVDVRSMEDWSCLREWVSDYGCLDMDLCFFLHQGFMAVPFLWWFGNSRRSYACTLYGGTRGVC